MNAELQLRVAGALQIALAALHVTFPRRFAWKEELGRLSLLNRQVFVVHTAFICLVLLMFGTLSALAPGALLTPTPLSRLVLGGLCTFWALRLVVQWCVYDRSLWRGHAFNRNVHFAFTALWLYFVLVYGSLALQQI
jgi:hypothetical protein